MHKVEAGYRSILEQFHRFLFRNMLLSCPPVAVYQRMHLYHLVLQICDKEWHYYVINVEFPVVTLYVDGVTYDPYLVTDDWPIHPSQIDVQLTVGACWQGKR